MSQIEYVYLITPENKGAFPIFCPPDLVMPVWDEQQVNSILLGYGGSAYYCPVNDTFYGKDELKYLSKDVIVVKKPVSATHYMNIFKNGISFMRPYPGVDGAFEVFNPYFGQWMPFWMAAGWTAKPEAKEIPF